KGQPAGIDNGQLRYSFDNQIGSSLLELDNNGDIISQEEYYPFGGTALFAARNTIEAKYKTVRYSGKERDATGLYYYGFRYYMPWLGRWLNADPAGTIDGLNLYRMVRNNPISLMDEDGRMPVRMTNDKESMIPTSIDYNIIIDTNIDYLYRADTRSPEEIEKAGGFSASGSIANAGTLGRFENGEPVEPILYTAEKVYGMKDFANKMPGERYFYKINASGLRVASYTKNFEGLKNTRNLVTHLKKQKQLMEKVIGEDWSNKTDTEIRKALITEDSSGPPSWMSLTTDAKEAHIIGDKKLLYKSKQLYEKDFQIPILVSWEKIEHIGSKEKGMLKKSKYMK
ncbi:TPA: RHS repeat-associated core domain-containing protein, partial [Yersinia enterocolitica]|nr:RHS repeat-associated core domain-containing protein [Yersinia enterocolitica]